MDPQGSVVFGHVLKLDIHKHRIYMYYMENDDKPWL